MNDASQFHFYSYGIVAENKPLSTRIVHVIPIEKSPSVDGQIDATKSAYTANAQDSSGSAYSMNLDVSLAVEAEWYPMNCPNRVTAPDVRRGHEVQLYRFADNDKFYWTTAGNGDDLYKLETVVHAVSATKDETAKKGPNNTYYVEMSSHAKIIHIHTSKADGEPFAYDIQINTKDGNVTIRDDAGNMISMDSKERQIELINADGSHYDMNKTELTVTIPDKITFVTKDMNIQADTMTTIISGENKLSAGTNTIDSTTTHNGNVVLEGALVVSETTAITGKTSLNGGFSAKGGSGGGSTGTIQGDVQVVGQVHGTKIISDQPIQAPSV